jgi:glycosyltransferase involved in cell wall biosynthesis
MDAIDISILIATYNRASLLRKALESLVRQETDGNFSYEILVVDDGSTDFTADVVNEVVNNPWGIPVTYIYQENRGQSAALNKGLCEARAAWLAFFDDDQWAEPRWLAELYRAAREQGADCVGGAICVDLPDAIPWDPGPRTRKVFAEKIPGRKIKDSKIKEVIGSGNILIHRVLFSQVGGFDPAFPRGFDTEFFYRLEKYGFRLGYAPKAIVHHVIPKSRLQRSYLRQSCFMLGVTSTRIRWHYQGPRGLILSILWRIGIALGVDLPLLIIAGVARHRPLFLDNQCSLWYTFSLIRASLFFLAPRLFPQRKFREAFNLHPPPGD